ncbi:GxxExxY protein [Lacibacter sediminis]|uniref:GxxExxY protein n=1 Tax=Lacibacter sediminis TaxID=2760713 RepID=A0A7G5XG72_9BACT|nr:GxxExxY protein [Lacibacter sediminis]QNA44475.1 GxxExxY protein [Lacibacter sediminis]
MTENEIATQVVDAALKIHKTLGPGLLEKAYEECLAYELRKRTLYVEQQKGFPLTYEEVKLEVGYRADLLVEHKLIVEIKSVRALQDNDTAQVLTYLKLSDCKLGLLINFNVSLLKNGIRRLILGQLHED